MPIYNAVNPLDSLQTNKLSPGQSTRINTKGYEFSYLTYPLQFDSISSFGHYMNFYINVQNFSQYMPGNVFQTNPSWVGFGAGTAALPWDKIYAPAYGSSFPNGAYTTNASETLGGMPGNAQGNNIAGVSANQYTQKRITQAISLYIPDSMSFTTGFDWQDASMTEMGGKTLKYGQDIGGLLSSAADYYKGKNAEASKTLAQVISDIGLNPTGQGSFGDAMLGVAGLAVNPQVFVLFRGIDLRQFQFDFIFTPKSPEEASNVRNIIKAFRFHASPEVSSDLSRYYIAPSTFNVEFMYRGNINRNIFQMSTCVITRLSVDYAPYGWSTFNDGMPVQTILSMVMKETEIITKEKVNQGY